jgi:hypothetical protein
MDLDILIRLWAGIMQYGTHVRKNGLNGLESWEKIKTLLEGVPCDTAVDGCTWSNEASGYFEQLVHLALVENEEGSSLSHEQWERHHFFIQLGRIPYRSKGSLSLVRLFQIAYNIGQLRCEFTKMSGDGRDHDEVYTPALMTFFRDNKLYDARSYASLETLACIEARLGSSGMDLVQEIIARM